MNGVAGREPSSRGSLLSRSECHSPLFPLPHIPPVATTTTYNIALYGVCPTRVHPHERSRSILVSVDLERGNVAEYLAIKQAERSFSPTFPPTASPLGIRTPRGLVEKKSHTPLMKPFDISKGIVPYPVIPLYISLFHTRPPLVKACLHLSAKTSCKLSFSLIFPSPLPKTMKCP